MPHHDTFVTFQITNRCNLSCHHCINRAEDRSANLPFPLYKDIVDQLETYGVERIGFGGGEPTIHPQFPEMLSYVLDKEMAISLVTNALTFPKISHLLKGRLAKLERLTFSLDGARAETNDYVRGPGSFRRVMEAIATCHREGIPFGLSTVITSKSYKEAAELCFLAARVGANSLWFNMMHPTPDAARHGLELPPEKYLEIGAEMFRLSGAFSFPVLIGEGSHRMPAWMLCLPQNMRLFTVDPLGNLTLCGVLAQRAGSGAGGEVAGNLAEMSFAEAHRRLIRIIGGLQEARSRAIEQGALDSTDVDFPCWFCARYFHKVDWIADFPDHPWAAAMERSRSKVTSSPV